jgi:hypothetical protein
MFMGLSTENLSIRQEKTLRLKERTDTPFSSVHLFHLLDSADLPCDLADPSNSLRKDDGESVVDCDQDRLPLTTGRKDCPPFSPSAKPPSAEW